MKDKILHNGKKIFSQFPVLYAGWLQKIWWNNFFLILMECIVRSSPLPLLGEALCQGTEVYILTALVK